MSKDHCPWTLTDALHPEMMRTGTETVSINDEDQLNTILISFVQLLPRELLVRSPQGELLFVWIGGPSASVHYYRGPDNDPGLMAKPPLKFDKPAYFSAEGQPTEVDPEYLMSPETAIRLILDFYRTGSLPSWIEWEEG
jgi:hypothetical protein